MSESLAEMHMETARGHIARANLPEDQAGNRDLCWHLAGVSLSAAHKLCERNSGKYKPISPSQTMASTAAQ